MVRGMRGWRDINWWRDGRVESKLIRVDNGGLERDWEA